MKRILLVIAALVMFQACINEDGVAIKLPDSMARQWLGEDLFPDGTVYRYQVWDFESNKDRLSIVYFLSIEDAKMFPSYTIRKEYIYSYECRYQKGVYTLTIDDENKTRVYLSDVKNDSMILTFEDGFTMNMTRLPFTLTAVPVDY